MSLFRKLTEKPWTIQGALEEQPAGSVATVYTAKTGLYVFLAVVTSLFGLFISAYHMRADYPDWLHVQTPAVLWFNTLVLVLTSIAFQRSKVAAAAGDFAGMRGGLTIGGLLTAVFLVGQYWAWQQMAASGFYAQTNAAYGFFYLLTGVHALHLLGGLWVWARTTFRVWRGFDQENVDEVGRIRLRVELCTVYWHFLLLVWLVVFGLLLTT